MRYEHITLDLSTAALDLLRTCLELELQEDPGTGKDAAHVRAELENLFNEIEARLQRRDQDPHAAPDNMCELAQAIADRANQDLV